MEKDLSKGILCSDSNRIVTIFIIWYRSAAMPSELRKSPEYVLWYTNIAWLIFTGKQITRWVRSKVYIESRSLSPNRQSSF